MIGKFARQATKAFIRGVAKAASAVANPGKPDPAAGEENHEQRIRRQRAAELLRMGLTEREFRESQVRPGAETDPAVRRANVQESLWSGFHERFYSRWEGPRPR